MPSAGVSAEWTDSTALGPRWLWGKHFSLTPCSWASSSGPWVSLQLWQVGGRGRRLSMRSCLGIRSPAASPHHLCSCAVLPESGRGGHVALGSSCVFQGRGSPVGSAARRRTLAWGVLLHSRVGRIFHPPQSILQERSLFSNHRDVVAG